MFFTDILTKEKIKAGKYILNKLVDEGWEVHGAAWLLHGHLPSDDEWYPSYEIFKHWSLHFIVPHDTLEVRINIRCRTLELRDAYINELYSDILAEDYFDISVESPDTRLAKWLISQNQRPMTHPLGERLRANNRDIRDGFVYNLQKIATPERAEH